MDVKHGEAEPALGLSTVDQLRDLSDAVLDRAVLRCRTRRTRFQNWAHSYECQPKAIYEPSDVTAVQRIVEYARRRGEEVRVVGAGHSPGDVFCTTGLAISLRRLCRMSNVRRSLNRRA